MKEHEHTVLQAYQTLEISDLDALKKITLGTCDIGMAVASSLISELRDPLHEVAKHLPFIRNGLSMAALTYYSVRNHLQALRPNRMYIFNGRFASVRPAFRAAKELGFEVYTHERGGILGKYALFANVLPHELEPFKQRIQSVWEQSPLREVEKCKIAEGWFRARRAGKTQSWTPFTANQSAELPPTLDASKTIVTIFKGYFFGP